MKKKISILLKFLNSDRGELIILIGIILIGFLVRLYKINSPIADWHSFRQADTASVARLFDENGINLLLPKYHDISRVQSGIFNPEGYRFVEFPIYNAIHSLLFGVFPQLGFEVWGRLLSVIFSIFSGYFLYKIGKYFNKWVGIFAIFIFLMMPFNIYFSRVILPEPMAVMFSVVSLWYFIEFQKKQKTSLLFLSGLFLTLGILVKPYVLFYFLPIGVYFVSKYKIRDLIKRKDFVLYVLIILLPFVLWRIWISQFPEGIPFWKWTMNGDGIRFKPAFFYWIFSERIGKLMLGVWGVVPFVYGITKSINNKKSLMLWLIAGPLVYLIFFATANVRHDYYQTLIVPSISLLTAYGGYYIFIDWGKSAKYMLAIFFILSFLISAFQVKEYYKINHPEIIAAGNAANKIIPKDSLVIAAYNGDTAFLYQTKRRGWPVVELPIDELINEGAQYYVSVNLNDRQTIEFENRFETLEKTDNYVILKLTDK